VTDDDLYGLFSYALRQLDVDESGLTDANQLADLNACAAICRAVKTAIAASAETTVAHLLRHRLATLTEDLLAAPWVPNQTTAAEWLCARSELLQAQLPHA
jgi:hypothetical protein